MFTFVFIVSTFMAALALKNGEASQLYFAAWCTHAAVSLFVALNYKNSMRTDQIIEAIKARDEVAEQE